jgi:hypothetical protein
VILVPRAVDPGNPDPERIRRWHIENPYYGERCYYCDKEIGHGELINVEYEVGIVHASCGDGA